MGWGQSIIDIDVINRQPSLLCEKVIACIDWFRGDVHCSDIPCIGRVATSIFEILYVQNTSLAHGNNASHSNVSLYHFTIHLVSFSDVFQHVFSSKTGDWIISIIANKFSSRGDTIHKVCGNYWHLYCRYSFTRTFLCLWFIYSVICIYMYKTWPMCILTCLQ